ncbi:MAG: hypothetical protein LKI24_03175 [Acidipropionibacterium sp.]|nr:hypothetical protein [Acidipropionibacterium sp.]
MSSLPDPPPAVPSGAAVTENVPAPAGEDDAHTLVVVTRLKIDEQLRELTSILGGHWQVSVAPSIPQGDPRITELIVPPGTRLDGSQLPALPGLRAVATTSIGTDHLDLEALSRAGIPVVTAQGFNSREVADHTLACILAAVRDLANGVSLVRDGGWGSLQTHPRLVSLTTLGLIGFGGIARLVAADALALGMRVMVCNRSALPAATLKAGIAQVGIGTLMRQADIVSVHVPLTDGTRGMIGRRELEAAHEGIVIINTARAGIIDQDALADALNTGRVSQAWLDVLATEPPDPQDPLIDCRNAIITPHMAWLSPQSSVKGYRMVAQRLARLASDTP